MSLNLEIMTLYTVETLNEKDELLLLVTKITETIMEDTKTKQQETLHYKMNERLESFFSKIPRV